MSQPAIRTSLTSAKRLVSLPFTAYLKNEYEQPSGLFKLRGIGNMVARLLAAAAGKRCAVFLSSGGNAGLAAAYAARHYELPCTVCLPVTTKAAVKAKLEAAGAAVVVHGAHWGEADAHLKDIIADSKDTHPIYVHPFDHEWLWEGHATLVDEVVEQLGADSARVRGFVCSVGGGGLYNGVVEGIRRNAGAWGRMPGVVAVETRPAPTLHAALEAGQVVHLLSVPTKCTLLALPYISAQALANATSSEPSTTPVLIEDVEAVDAAVRHYEALGINVEGACGASLFALTDPELRLVRQAFGELAPEDIVVVVACGGVATTVEELRLLQAELHA